MRSSIKVADIKDVIHTSLHESALNLFDHIQKEVDMFLESLASEMEGQFDKAIEDAACHLEDMTLDEESEIVSNKFERQTAGEKNDCRNRRVFVRYVIDAYSDTELGDINRLKRILITCLLSANSAERQSRSRCA